MGDYMTWPTWGALAIFIFSSRLSHRGEETEGPGALTHDREYHASPTLTSSTKDKNKFLFRTLLVACCHCSTLLQTYWFKTQMPSYRSGSQKSKISSTWLKSRHPKGWFLLETLGANLLPYRCHLLEAACMPWLVVSFFILKVSIVASSNLSLALCLSSASITRSPFLNPTLSLFPSV